MISHSLKGFMWVLLFRTGEQRTNDSSKVFSPCGNERLLTEGEKMVLSSPSASAMSCNKVLCGHPCGNNKTCKSVAIVATE
jgi:hypothetical protein